MKKLPKEDLQLKLTIETRWNSIIPTQNYSVEDSYTVDYKKFGDKEVYKSQFDKYPIISVLSERNDLLIIKEIQNIPTKIKERES